MSLRVVPEGTGAPKMETMKTRVVRTVMKRRIVVVDVPLLMGRAWFSLHFGVDRWMTSDRRRTQEGSLEDIGYWRLPSQSAGGLLSVSGAIMT